MYVKSEQLFVLILKKNVDLQLVQTDLYEFD